MGQFIICMLLVCGTIFMIFMAIWCLVFNSQADPDVTTLYLSFLRFKRLYEINTDRYWLHEYNHTSFEHLFLLSDRKTPEIQIRFYFISFFCFIIWYWFNIISFKGLKRHKNISSAYEKLLRYSQQDIENMKKKAPRYAKQAEEVYFHMKER